MTPIMSQVGRRRAYVYGDAVALKKVTGTVKISETPRWPYVSLGDVRAAKYAAKLWTERGKVSKRLLELVTNCNQLN